LPTTKVDLALPRDAPLAQRYQTLDVQLRAMPDPQQRFMACVDHARQRPWLPDPLKTSANRVEGCQVRIWFVAHLLENGRCEFLLDSDAITLKAVAGLLCDLYTGALPEEIVANPPLFLDDLRLTQSLAENRRRTVERIAEGIQAFARQHTVEAKVTAMHGGIPNPNSAPST
jgi:cysteine desulfuration protein SufE